MANKLLAEIITFDSVIKKHAIQVMASCKLIVQGVELFG